MRFQLLSTWGSRERFYSRYQLHENRSSSPFVLHSISHYLRFSLNHFRQDPTINMMEKLNLVKWHGRGGCSNFNDRRFLFHLYRNIVESKTIRSIENGVRKIRER